MKTKPVTREPGTFEDLVFEGRNKSYGAFDLNRKRNRYLVSAFLIAFAGISTSIAVPFLNALKGDEGTYLTVPYDPVVIKPIQPKNDIPLPPPPEKIESIERIATNLEFKVVENTDDDLTLITEDLLEQNVNKPVEPEIFVQTIDNAVIPDEKDDDIVLFPSEPATFMGGDVMAFRSWVSENIKYPAEAADNNIFGKVLVEFCINNKGEVVDIKILRSLHPTVDQETMRVISSSPRWIPAKQGGTPVKTKFIIPFMFDLI